MRGAGRTAPGERAARRAQAAVSSQYSPALSSENAHSAASVLGALVRKPLWLR